MKNVRYDLRKEEVFQAFLRLGFIQTSHGNHCKFEKHDNTAKKIVVSIPNHKNIKGVLLLRVLREAGIDKKEFLALL